jgi:hypothetical protein
MTPAQTCASYFRWRATVIDAYTTSSKQRLTEKPLSRSLVGSRAACGVSGVLAMHAFGPSAWRALFGG